MLPRLLQPAAEAAYAALRIVAGLTFAFIGLQKLTGYLSEFKAEAFTQMWFGGVIELAGGLLIAAGFLTPWAAFVASGTMAVAYIQFHWKFDFGKGFFPAVNQGGPALLYCFMFLYMACKGSGIWSVDAILQSKAAARSRPGSFPPSSSPASARRL